MKNVVWKYMLPTAQQRNGTVKVPSEAKLLKINPERRSGDLGWNIFAWFFIPNTNKEKEEREFHIVGTGWDAIPDELIYRETVYTGIFVWHVFEKPVG